MDERRRSIAILSGGVALAATGYIAAITVGTLAGDELGGSAAWAGVPTATSVLGTAFGAGLLAWIGGRFGRRPSLVAGYIAGALGGLAAAAALLIGSLPLLLVAMLVIGLPNAASQLSRYAGGDMYGPGQRARAIGTVVWGATIGAIVGPNLIGPTGAVAAGFGISALSGAYLMAAAVFLVAGLLSHILLRPDPAELAGAAAQQDPGTGRAVADPAGVRGLLSHPGVSVAIITLVSGQFVMVMVMTMTPLHLRDHGHDLGIVGLVMSAHTLGMFALAPLSGRLTARFGSAVVVLAGFAILAVASVIAAVAPASGGPVLIMALFLLGFGWNLGFVAGSALLAGRFSTVLRTRLQGMVDAAVWGTSAISSVLAGPILGLYGYAGLGLLAAGLAILPALFVALRRASLAPQAA